jgi:CubicO group peptidase (beta-lactamase class C family)
MWGQPYGEISEYEKSLWAAKSVKILCSAVFVSGRDINEAFQNSVLSHDVFRGQTIEIICNLRIDRDKKSVTLKLKGSPERTAVFYGDQGCVTLPLDSKKVFFNPVKVQSTLPDAKTQKWPMGDIIPEQTQSTNINKSRLEEAVETAFSNPEAYTTAFLVLHNGDIIAERYDLGINKDTQLESWSMGKSITSTLIGIMIKEKNLSLHDYAPIPEWHLKGDPRSKIRISDLLRMSSGLRFSGADDPPEKHVHNFPDHEYVYSGSVDVFQFSINKQLEFTPNTLGRYRNCDPLSLGYIIKRKLIENGEEYLSWPQKALFDKIGIRKQVLETDPYGNFIMTGFDYGTARNWARLGLLYLQEGIWEEKRLLTKEFVDFIKTPAPGWKEPVYGGLFWLNHTKRYNLPEDAYWMAGIGVQRVIIVPSLNIVVVRMGHRSGGKIAETTLNEALFKLTKSIN